MATQSNDIELNLGAAVDRVQSWVDGGVELLPNLAVAIVLFIFFIGLSVVIRKVVERSFISRGRGNLGEVLSVFVKWAILLVGFMLAATVVVPSINPGDLIAGLGVSSVAIGFAFKDILQNSLAGLLILWRQPFEVGDQVEVEGWKGTVVRIETRATIIKTFDGQRVVVPNSDIYTNSILVKTAHEKRRTEYDVGIGYSDDIQEAIDTIKAVLEKSENVESDPVPDIFVWDLAASWVTLRVRWWTDSQMASVLEIRSKVLRGIKESLDERGIDMPYDTQVHLFHDQTEDRDGKRKDQREGWPEQK